MTSAPATLTLLDGPMGSALEALGHPLPAPLWSAAAVAEAPDDVQAVHARYAACGVDVHTTATFRTTQRALAGSGHDWRALTRRAVELCRSAAGPSARVAGSMASLEDCWRPDLTPSDAELALEHGRLARELADAGCDLLLVETMPTVRELAAGVRAAAATGLPVWSCVSLGPDGDFLSDADLADAACAARDAGAAVFGLNCTPADAITPRLERLAQLDARPPGLIAYGNAIFAGGEAWTPERYLAEATRWRDLGARVLGACCGTDARHVEALASLR